jgi:hypothetical protein
MSFSYLQKWYFDLLTPSGDALYLYFISFRVAGIKRGMASAHLVFADRTEIRSSVRTPFATLQPNGNLSLGRHSFSNHKDFVDLHMEFDNLALDLRYSTLVGPWQPAAEGILWQKNQKRLGWRVPQPEARVEGTIAFGSQKIFAAGLGYQDIVETNIEPWNLPIAELLWGRAHCDGHAIVFNQIKTREGEVLQYIMLRRASEPRRDEPCCDNSNDAFLLERDEQDGVTTITHKSFTLTLRRRSIIEESRISTQERFKSKLVRRFLDRTCGSPEEKKMVSEAVLQLDGRTYRGQALHERACWHWKKQEQA